MVISCYAGLLRLGSSFWETLETLAVENVRGYLKVPFCQSWEHDLAVVDRTHRDHGSCRHAFDFNAASLSFQQHLQARGVSFRTNEVEPQVRSMLWSGT